MYLGNNNQLDVRTALDSFELGFVCNGLPDLATFGALTMETDQFHGSIDK